MSKIPETCEQGAQKTVHVFHSPLFQLHPLLGDRKQASMAGEVGSPWATKPWKHELKEVRQCYSTRNRQVAFFFFVENHLTASALAEAKDQCSLFSSHVSLRKISKRCRYLGTDKISKGREGFFPHLFWVNGAQAQKPGLLTFQSDGFWVAKAWLKLVGQTLL